MSGFFYFFTELTLSNISPLKKSSNYLLVKNYGSDTNRDVQMGQVLRDHSSLTKHLPTPSLHKNMHPRNCSFSFQCKQITRLR